MIFHEQATSDGTIFNVPATIKPNVLVGEFLGKNIDKCIHIDLYFNDGV